MYFYKIPRLSLISDISAGLPLTISCYYKNRYFARYTHIYIVVITLYFKTYGVIRSTLLKAM